MSEAAGNKNPNAKQYILRKKDTLKCYAFDARLNRRIAQSLECHLTFPVEIMLSGQYSDFVIGSSNSKSVYPFESTVPFDENIERTH